MADIEQSVVEEVALPQTEEVSTEEVSTESSATEEAATPQDTEVQSQEDNAKYADIRRKAEEKARQKSKQEVDTKFSELFGDEYGIKTVDDYLDAIKGQREQDKVNKLIEENVPEQYAKEMIENQKFREQYQTEQQKKVEETKRLEELKEFQNEYPDVKLDAIPKEVFEQIENGRTLTDAYSRYEVKALKDQLAQYKKQTENGQLSTGPIAISDGGESTDLTDEMVSKMSPQEISRRWKDVKKLYKMK